MVGPPSEGELCLGSMKIEILWLPDGGVVRQILVCFCAPATASSPASRETLRWRVGVKRVAGLRRFAVAQELVRITGGKGVL
jgi:hypothetical protein